MKFTPTLLRRPAGELVLASRDTSAIAVDLGASKPVSSSVSGRGAGRFLLCVSAPAASSDSFELTDCDGRLEDESVAAGHFSEFSLCFLEGLGVSST